MAKTKSLRQSYPREYRIWKAMRARCYSPCNKNIGNYQKNGIIVCDRWNSFDSFITDMGPCPNSYTIDRIDNNGNYEPNNCRWISMSEQAKNRGSFNKFYTYKDKTLCLKDWAKELGIKYITLEMRVIRHPEYPFEKIIEDANPSHKLFEYEGRTYTRKELCEKYNISLKTFYDRYHKGWSIEKIIKTPINNERSNSTNRKKKSSKL